MTRICVLGADPGINGALAIYIEDDIGGRVEHRLEFLDIPTSGEDAKRRVIGPAIQNWIGTHKPTRAFVENVGSMPDQGIASAYRFGRAVGAIETAIACSGVPFDLVAPISWKKYFGLKGPDKEQSRALAIRRFPFAASCLARKLDHQRAEAALIAYYGYVERR